jgi:nucleotide-binding universal stress UspA family protein
MYQRILVPLDGSSFGEHALPLALGLVRQAGVPLHLVHVIRPASDHVVGDFGVAIDLDNEIRGAEYHYLTQQSGRLAGLTEQAVTSVMPEGVVAEEVAREALTSNADLIVMTTHGRGPLSRFWLGSVADQLIRQAPVPVLLVRPAEECPDLSAVHELHHVLITLDGGPIAEEVIEPAIALGEPFQARYTLLRVIPPASDMSVAFPEGQAAVSGQRLLDYLHTLDEQLEADARADLERTAERLRARGLSVEMAVTRNAQAAAGILDYAHTHAVDVIALETHGRAGLARLFLGSVADKVLRGATIPVLVQRPLPRPNTPSHQEPTGFERRCRKADGAAAKLAAADHESNLHPGCLHGR